MFAITYRPTYISHWNLVIHKYIIRGSEGGFLDTQQTNGGLILA